MTTLKYCGVLLSVLALTAPLAASGAPAKTKEFSIAAVSGQPKQIDDIVGWTEDCAPYQLIIRVTKRPANGRVELKSSTRVISQRADAGKIGKCAGKRIKSRAAWYQSERGFRGSVDVELQVTSPGLPVSTIRYKIKVR